MTQLIQARKISKELHPVLTSESVIVECSLSDDSLKTVVLFYLRLGLPHKL